MRLFLKRKIMQNTKICSRSTPCGSLTDTVGKNFKNQTFNKPHKEIVVLLGQYRNTNLLENHRKTNFTTFEIKIGEKLFANY